MPAEQIPDNDVVRIHERVSAAVGAIRAGQPGPFFFECLTYRLKEHVGPNEDFQLGYRSREEAEPWIETIRLRNSAIAIDPDGAREIEAEVEAEIRDAFAFAEASPFPEPPSYIPMFWRPEMMIERKLSYVEAIREATDQEMAPRSVGHRIWSRRRRSQGDSRNDARAVGKIRLGARLRHAAFRGCDDRAWPSAWLWPDCVRSTCISAWIFSCWR